MEMLRFLLSFLRGFIAELRPFKLHRGLFVAGPVGGRGLFCLRALCCTEDGAVGDLVLIPIIIKFELLH